MHREPCSTFRRHRLHPLCSRGIFGAVAVAARSTAAESFEHREPRHRFEKIRRTVAACAETGSMVCGSVVV